MRQGEHDVEVVGVEQVTLLGFKPSPARLRLALRTAPRPAGVVGDGCFVRATDTLVLVSTKGSGAATLYSPICLQLLVAEAGLVASQKLLALCADDVSDFKCWTTRGGQASATYLYQPPNCSAATTAATAAPAASFKSPFRPCGSRHTGVLQMHGLALAFY